MFCDLLRLLQLAATKIDDGMQELNHRALLLDRTDLGLIENDPMTAQVQVQEFSEGPLRLRLDQRRGRGDAWHRISLVRG